MLGQEELCMEMEYSRLQYLMEDSAHQESQADIYKRIRVLGCGSYGRAFLVQDKQLGEEWAIKQINLGDMAPEEQEAALKEAKILQMLKHPNIVRFREVYRTAKMKLNIVMQYAAGGDLAHRIKDAKDAKIHFSERQILDWFVQICLAVRYIHSNKIIHRDLKAQNVFLTQAGLIKLGDFGVARVLEHSAARARTVVGSPYYFSPELIENRPYSFKTDIWSLGALLYELCALQPPFQANNLQFLALKIVQGAPPPLPKMYSEGLRSLVRFMLQTKESNRPTIHQIFSERIILDTIKRLNEGRQPQTTPVSQTVSDFNRLSTLKPPPNLLGLDPQENKSDIVMVKNQRKDEEDDISYNNKSKTPQVIVKKGPKNFFQRPMTGRKRSQSSSADVDLAGLMQIKPSHLEKHEKHQKPQIPLPPVPKNAPSSKVVSGAKSPQVPHPQPLQQLPSSAFIKKKTSYPHIQPESKSSQKREQSQQEIKPTKPSTKKIDSKVPKKEKEQKKPQIRRKTFGGSAGFKQEAAQIKLEVCSEELKKRQLLQKKTEKKKVEKTVKKNQKLKKQKKKSNRQQEQQEVMQEQKFNSDQELVSNKESQDDYCSSYYDQQFESYSEESEEEVDLAFSITNEGLNINFQQILAELGRIQKIVETGQDIEKAQGMGESIPELIDFSSEVREDDSQLDSNHSIHLTSKEAVIPQEAKLATNSTRSNAGTEEDGLEQIDLGCLSTHAQLEIVRMKLQGIFGVDNIIFAYKVMEQFLFKEGLNFSEEEVIGLILAQKPSINQKALRKYFGHIAAIITKENNLV